MVIMVTVLYPETFSTVCKKLFLQFASRLKGLPNEYTRCLNIGLHKNFNRVKTNLSYVSISFRGNSRS